MRSPKISVVIPAHNRIVSLEEIINAILDQSFKDFELLVVGFKGNNTVSIVKEKFFDKRVKFFKIGNSFPSAKRNFGIAMATAPIVAFTDDDCLPEKNWLKKIVARFNADSKLAGVEGLTCSNNKLLFCHASKNLSGGCFPACNFAFRTNWLKRVDGFDEGYDFFREDTDLAFAIISAGGKIVFDEGVRVFHPPRCDLPFSFSLGELKNVKSDIRLWSKFPVLYKEHFGFICKGSFKQALFSWIALLWLIGIIVVNSLALFILGIFGIVMFKFFVEMRGKQFPLFGGLVFVICSFVRDLIFPFVFAWNFVKGLK